VQSLDIKQSNDGVKARYPRIYKYGVVTPSIV
jgi:hypothetical protein